jgi:histidine triad (HIT) family protein
MECIFCKIINKEISSNFIFEDEDIIVINDLHPKSRIHMLIIPKKHIPTISELEDLDQNLIGKIFLVTRNLAKQNNIN